MITNKKEDILWRSKRRRKGVKKRQWLDEMNLELELQLQFEYMRKGRRFNGRAGTERRRTPNGRSVGRSVKFHSCRSSSGFIQFEYMRVIAKKEERKGRRKWARRNVLA